MNASYKASTAFILTAFLGLASSTVVLAKETVKEQAQEAGRDMKRGAKKLGRDIKDKTCEMVNGKMECAAQRAKHGVQNAADKVEDAID